MRKQQRSSRITSHAAPRMRKPLLTEGQRQFVLDARDRGLSRAETTRMFFRKYGQDISVSTVASTWRRFPETDQQPNQ